MISNNSSLLAVLSKLHNSVIERKELNLLIDKSYRKSIAILKTKYRIHFAPGRSDSEVLKNIAMDSIIPLFVIDKRGEYGLIRSFKNWNYPINTETEFDFFLFSLISRRVEQTFTNYLKEKDPIFEKILNTLNVSISNNNFKKVRYFGSVYVLDECTSKISGKVISPEEFEFIPNHYFKLKQKQLFDKLFDYLREEGNYCLAIPFNELVYKVKLFYSNNKSESMGNEQCINNKFVFEDLVEKSLTSVKKKLESYYIPSYILNESESDMIYEAFRNISSDMLNIGAYDILYKYLQYHDETITKEVYYLKYRNIMKYLLADFKFKIGQGLQ